MPIPEGYIAMRRNAESAKWLAFGLASSTVCGALVYLVLSPAAVENTGFELLNHTGKWLVVQSGLTLLIFYNAYKKKNFPKGYNGRSSGGIRFGETL